MVDKLMVMVSEINLWTWLILFVIYFIFDILYAKYIISVNKLRALRSANISVVMYLLTVFGTIAYVENFINVIPILLGSWLGTYVSISVILRNKIKNKKKNKKK